jgi:hypothetical protein
MDIFRNVTKILPAQIYVFCVWGGGITKFSTLCEVDTILPASMSEL